MKSTREMCMAQRPDRDPTSTEGWRAAMRRHVDARNNLRQLLRQHLKPHRVRG